jgi:hypothetical protein
MKHAMLRARTNAEDVMYRLTARLLLAPLLLVGLMLASDPAHALRCGNKLILDGMLESEVIAYCGEPTTVRDLGYVVRSFHPLLHGRPHGPILFRYGPGNYFHELQVTEFIYNFGPRKLMRRLRFEGGVLTEVETLGHGYIEK